MTEETTNQGADPEEVAAQVVRLAQELPGTPQRMKVEAAGTTVEVDWDTSGDAAAAVAEPGSAPPRDGEPSGPRITAPLVGTFYRSPGPGEPPFVEVGDVVSEGQQVGIVEAMKLMNPVEAPRSGTVVEVLADDGDMVEFSQPLFALASDEG